MQLISTTKTNGGNCLYFAPYNMNKQTARFDAKIITANCKLNQYFDLVKASFIWRKKMKKCLVKTC